MSGRRRAVRMCCPWRYMHRRRFLVVPVAMATWTATFFQSGPRASARGSGCSPSFRPEPRAAARPLRPEKRESEARRQGPEVGPWPEAKGYSPSRQGLQPLAKGYSPRRRPACGRPKARRRGLRPYREAGGSGLRSGAWPARTTLVRVDHSCTTASYSVGAPLRKHSVKKVDRPDRVEGAKKRHRLAGRASPTPPSGRLIRHKALVKSHS